MSDARDPADDIPAGARALARLNASRQRLRRELLPEEDYPAAGDKSTGTPLPRRLRALLRHWRYQLRHAPLGGMALTALQSWWHEHPLRVPAEALGNELRGSVVPLVRRHPIATVLVASAAGAALVAWRPWRWPVVSRQIKPLPRNFGRWVLRQLSQPAVQAMLAAWLASSVSRGVAAAEAEQDLPPEDRAPASSAPVGAQVSATAPPSTAAEARPAHAAHSSTAPPPFNAPAEPAQQPTASRPAAAAPDKPAAPLDTGIAASA